VAAGPGWWDVYNRTITGISAAAVTAAIAIVAIVGSRSGG